MLEIFICEDELEQRERLKKYIENYIMIENLDMKIAVCTGNPKEVIEYIREHNTIGLYFLDVDLQADKSGIALGAEIRHYDTQGSIVFVTTHSELTYLTFTYKVEAMDYITKDEFTDVQKRVIDCIDTANKRYNARRNGNKQRFKTKIGDKVISIDYDEILFFETSPQLHKIILHAMNRQVEFYGKLKEIVELDSRFYRCHNSYVVNKDNIAEIDMKKREIHMVNGEICYASSRFLKGLKNIVPQ